MKFYMREPDAALCGMAGLTLEQIGFYNLIIDLLYSRDGIVPNDNAFIARVFRLDPRRVRRLKTELMARGKIRTTVDGLLTANRVDEVRLQAEVRSKSARHQVNVRWENYRKAKESNGAAIQACNTTTSTIRKKEERVDEKTENVSYGDKSVGSGELEAIVQAKGWR